MVLTKVDLLRTVLLLLITGELARGELLGCFVKNTWQFNYRQAQEDLNNPSRCTHTCQRLGYRFAGVEGEVCSCSDQRPDDSKQTDLSDCNTRCPNSEETCGGPSRIQIYTVPNRQKRALEEKQYVGCFKDRTNRILSDYRSNFHDINTPGNCIYLCKQLGFKFAGVEYGFECFCGNQRPANEDLSDDTECSYSCPSSNEKCGGSWRLQVYSISSESSVKEPINGSDLGCYKDSKSRVLAEFRADLTNINSPQKCVYVCSQLGYKFAGVEYGNECFCGNERPNGKKMADDKCRISCPQSNEKCGGSWHINIFSVSSTSVLPTSEEPSTDLSCYKDSKNRVLAEYRADLDDINSPQKCTHVCSKLGFKFAGVENGIECFCGNERPNDELKADNSQCQKSCPNTLEKCGGTWHIHVFSVPTKPLPSTPEEKDEDMEGFLGCYKDSDGQVLPDYQMDLTYNLGHDSITCMYMCKRMGFLFAGLENVNYCHCGWEPPAKELEVSKRECANRCPNSTQMCGGPERILVFSTGNSR